MKSITIIKQDYQGIETWRYSGNIVSRSADKIVIEAFFDREDTPVDNIVLEKGDRFVESYFSDRWYNIYEIHVQESEAIKLWYCNIGYPAKISEQSISYRDLALDLIVYPDGQQKVLDEAEFEALPVSPDVKIAARQALLELEGIFST